MNDTNTSVRQLIDTEVIDRSFSLNPHEPHKTGWIFDFKRILLQPDKLDLIARALYEKIRHKNNFQLGGLETTAIILVTKLVELAQADGKNVNGFYIRKSGSSFNLHENIYGQLNFNPIILVDDVFNTGSSMLRQVELLERFDRRVEQLLAVVSFHSEPKVPGILERGIVVETIFSKAEFGVEDTRANQTIETPLDIRFDVMLPSEISDVTVLSDVGQIAVLTRSGTLYSIDDSSGEEVGSVSLGAGGHPAECSIVMYDQGVLYLRSGSMIKAVDVTHFTVANHLELPSETSSVIGLSAGRLMALSGATAEALVSLYDVGSQKRLATHAHGCLDSGELVHGGNSVVLLTEPSGRLRSLNTHTGELLWERTITIRGDKKFIPEPVFGAFNVMAGMVLFGASDGMVYALDEKTGTVKFTFHSDYDTTVIKSPVVAKPWLVDEHLIFAGWDRTLHRHPLSESTTEATAQTIALLGKVDALFIDSQKRAWSFTNNGIVHCHPFEKEQPPQNAYLPLHTGLNRVIYDETKNHFVVVGDDTRLIMLRGFTTQP